MALGDRADVGTIRQGKERTQITATFDIAVISDAKQWLGGDDFAEGSQCILRRIYTSEGRSKGYINGQPCTMQQLQQLGDMLVDLHGQHEHQSLLRRNTHRKLLDQFANSSHLAEKVATIFSQWEQTRSQIANLVEQSSELMARRELLEFQVAELQALNLNPSYLEQLEKEQQTLANAEQIVQDSQQLLAICDQDENFNLRNGFSRALTILSNLKHKPEALQEVEQLLQSGLIQVDEATHCIEHQVDSFEADPQRLQQIEDELGSIFQLTRKHQVGAAQLMETLNALKTELSGLTEGDNNLQKLQQQADQLANEYRTAANTLSTKRKDAARDMASQINHQLQSLSMKGAELLVQLTPLDEQDAKSYGLEEVELLIATNPGQAHKPLAKIASGGELSRVSLAIQVVGATNTDIPTLVFDEVDVGIGGSTADVVGQLLKQLGDRGQVISVTHQPQVAARAHHHYSVSKITENSSAESTILNLDKSQRVEELARMLGGAKVTQQTVSHASELLELASS